jgi:GAF domain-containing protein/HAMP domain-containing protein
MKAVLIAEIEQQEVTQKTINISMTNSIIGFFTLLLAFVIVFITSRSISLPIANLAVKAANFADGKLETRMEVNRHDEIGKLASSFNGMADELQTLIQTLENKVKDRTQDLEKQANYLRVAAEIARESTTARNLDDLLNNAALLVLNRFGFYHTGIFLLDEHQEYAVLRASPTKAGQEMLARHHRLKIGQVGIVGNVAASGLSRVALDTSTDSTFFNNPLLPDTHSEIALPLKVNNNLIGVLDVQSQEPNAFSQDDISILQIMADQLALAIQRVLLSTEQAENLREIENAYQSFTLSSWKSFSQGVEFKKGYSFDGMNISPIENLPLEYQDSLANGISVVSNNQSKKDSSESTLAVPLKLRDKVIGALTIGFNYDVIPPETISLAEEIAGRLAIALENARLYTETQMAAERERAISQASTNIGKAVDIDSILRYMAEELGAKLKDVEVAVQIGRDDEYFNG